MSDQPRLDEQALSKVAEMTLSSQLDAAEKINVDVRTDVLKVAQGEVDSVSIEVQGLVTQKDIRVQEMELHTTSIDINPLSALFGQLELEQPLDATARIVLNEQDINRTLSSEYLRSKFQKLTLNVEGETAVIEPQHIELHLPVDGKMVFHVNTLLRDETGKTRQIGFIATMLFKTGEQSLQIEGFTCTPPGEGVSLEFAITFLRKLRELLNLPVYELEGTAFQVRDVEVYRGSLTLHLNAHVKQIPSA